MAKGPHKAGQLPRTVTKPFGFCREPPRRLGKTNADGVNTDRL
nr:MAG TPA: hypothetical protein [Caudoviricetes sp.]DAN03408.1 MAG TPA: hypothetical protein [Caudoviricetes sp.]